MTSSSGSRRWSARFGRLLAWIVPDADPVGGVAWWRGRILAAVLLTCVVVGFLVLVPNVWLAIENRVWNVVVLDAVVYATLIGLVLGRQLPAAARAWGLLSLTWALGTFFSWNYGGLAAGPEWLLATPVLAGVLLGVRSTILTLVLTALTTVVIGVVATSGGLPWTGPQAATFRLPSPAAMWMIIGTNLLLLAGLGALGAAVLARGLSAQGAARARAEAELLLIGRALEQGDDLVLLVAPDGTIARVNAGRAAVAAGAQVGGAFPALPLRSVEDADVPWRSAFDGASWVGRCRLGEDPDGASASVVQVSIDPVRGDDGTITHALVVARDVTRQSALEERLRTSAKLEAVGTMVGGIAHDFNNLLQPVLANAGELRHLLPPSHPGRGLLEDIEASATRGRGLVRRILTFSRGVEMPRVPTDLADVITEALRLSDVRRDPSITVEVAVAGHPWVLADPAELHHVVVNLVTNARDAMPHGGTLSLRAQIAPASATRGPEAVLTVRDTGTGMDDATRRRIFEPFFSTKAPGRGTGLGLATVHGTVRALGGTIDVQSAVGVGTQITIRLPAMTEAPDAAPRPADIVAAAVAPTAPLLLVDDDDAVRRATVRLLLRAGYQVEDVADPREALRLVTQRGPAFGAVLTDLTMPHLSGTALAAAIRAVQPTLPVLLLTGMVDAADADAARAEGVATVLAKPFTPRELTDAVAHLLERHAS